MSSSHSIHHEVSEDEAAELVSELVSIDSRNPPGYEEPVAEFILDRLNEWGITARRFNRPDEERPQVIAEVGDGDADAGTLVLNGHIDVVPPGDVSQWSYDPFGGEIEGNRVYGRGASDMKSGVAAGMFALRAAHKNGGIDGKVILTCVMGEETAEPGTKTVLEEVDGDWGIVLEPTEMVVKTVGKGLVWYEVEIEGDSSHASRPNQGKNVLDGLFESRERINRYRTRIAERSHDLVGRSICTPTILEAGVKENVIPHQAELTLDRRFLPSEEVSDIDREIEDVFADLREDGFSVTIERTRTYDAAEIDSDHQIAEVVRQHADDVADVSTAPSGMKASTDQRNFVNDADIPAIIWGPGVSDQSHTIDEWAPVDSVVDATEVLCRTIENLCTT